MGRRISNKFYFCQNRTYLRPLHLSGCEMSNLLDLQLFRERLSEKVHATIPKGIVGGFEFAVLQ